MHETPEIQTHAFRLEVPGLHQYVKSARRFVVSICRLAGIDEETRDCLALALTEILNNSIDHGGCSKDVPIELRVEISEARIRLVVTERCTTPWEGPDMDSVREGLSEPNPDDTQFRGRGLLLVCSLMDEMNIHTTPGGATVVEVVKNR